MEGFTDRIALRGMVFYGRHGARSAERELGQRFVVDLEVGADLSEAGRTDDLGRTISYSELYRLAREVVEGEPRNLLEAVGERICERALAYDRALWVRVRITKPSVPIPGALEAAEVELLRRRSAP